MKINELKNDSSLDGIDLQTKVLKKNLEPRPDVIKHNRSSNTFASLFDKTQTNYEQNVQKSPKITPSTFKKGFFTNEERNLVNDTICEYALSKDLSIEQIMSFFKSYDLENVPQLNTEDKDSLWYHLTKNMPNRSINSIYKYIYNNYFHKENNNRKNSSNSKDGETPIYDPQGAGKKMASFLSEENLGVGGGKEYNCSSSPLIIQLTLLKSIQYFLDKNKDIKNKGLKLIKNDFNFVNKKIMENEEYKIIVGENKIIIDEKFKDSVDYFTNIFFVRKIIDYGILLKIHDDNLKLNWNIITDFYNNLMGFKEEKVTEDELKEVWNGFLQEYKVDKICNIRKEKKMIKEYIIKHKNIIIIIYLY